MFAYEATFQVDGSDKEVILVGAPNLAAAARKAKEEEKKGKELVSLQKTDQVIL